MDSIFPFGFPWQTSLYLVLYIGTLVLHVVLMNYVIAGTTVLAIRGVMSPDSQRRPIGTLLRDWMPFALGGAITAGVAPLLFIQILYQQRFYTANLLLFHRWMVILPVLIAGFYGLYLYKSKWLDRRAALARAVMGAGTLICFLFVGYSWTENHLLSIRDQETWTQFYGSGRRFYFEASLVPRLLVWFLGAFPTMLMLLGWQLRRLERQTLLSVSSSDSALPNDTNSRLATGGVGADTYRFSAQQIQVAIRQVGRLALIALVLTLLAGGLYGLLLPSEVRSTLIGSFAGPYLVLALIGVVIQFVGWWRVTQTVSLLKGHLSWITLGTVLALVCMTVQREAIRLAQIDIEPLFVRHAESARVGGIWVFLAFLFFNVIVILGCIQQVTRDIRAR